MFGVSFSEILLLALIALFVVGPRKLPAILNTMGKWVRKLRNVTTEVRTQMGMDEFLRKEGLHGGLTELRGLMRGGLAGAALSSVVNPTSSTTRPLVSDSREVADDRTREYPPEGPDAYGALPDDLIDDEPSADTNLTVQDASSASPAVPDPLPASVHATPEVQPDKTDA